ncbi:hypothetical protein ACWV26_11880 [Rummeliibacillus sp. JY-2-4R]
MKGNQGNKGNWSRFIIFTLIVGLIVGIFSVISDNLPNIGDGVTTLEFVISYLAVMINSLPIWFILAMLVGYVFARSFKEAALLGTIYTLVAMTFYLIISYFNVDIPVDIPAQSFKEQAFSFARWYGGSFVGGFIGGSVGFLVKKTPYALLILFVGIIFQMFLYGTSSWGSIVGIAQNVTFCLTIVSIVFYIVYVKRKKEPNLGT